jgi:enoyl-[acyl-carrier-protein] reductase (NADH)
MGQVLPRPTSAPLWPDALFLTAYALLVGRAARLEDVGNVAAFVASDRARTMTAATANISCGALVD